MKFIDSHCHLDYRSFKSDVDKVIIRAKKNNIIAIVSSTIDTKIGIITRLKNKYKNYVFHSLGLHPPGYTKESVRRIKDLIRDNLDTIVSIGEVGLDYHWVKDPKLRDYQEQAFIEFIELAKEVDKPLVIHSRKAEKEALDILEAQGDVSKVLMHCFNGNVDLIDRIVNNGWLLSVPTAVVNRKNHQKIAQACPLDSMVIETDAPFLSPDKVRRNEPSKVYYSAKKIAELKQIPISQVAEKTTQNAIDFYSLPI